MSWTLWQVRTRHINSYKQTGPRKTKRYGWTTVCFTNAFIIFAHHWVMSSTMKGMKLCISHDATKRPLSGMVQKNLGSNSGGKSEMWANISSSTHIEEALACSADNQLSPHLNHEKVVCNTPNSLKNLFTKFPCPKAKIEGPKCVMVHVHTLIFLTEWFSDCFKLHGCLHYSIAYNISFILSCRSQSLCISLLFCASVVFLLFSLPVHREEVILPLPALQICAFWKFYYRSVSKHLCGASCNPVCKFTMHLSDHRSSKRGSSKWNFMETICYDW